MFMLFHGVLWIQHPKFIDVGSSTTATSARRRSVSDTERSRTTRLDVPLVGSFGISTTSSKSGASFGSASTGRNGRIGHRGIQDGRVEHGDSRGRHGHPMPQPTTADHNSHPITIDAAHEGFEADVRGEPDGRFTNITGNNPTGAHALDADVGTLVGSGTEVNSEGSPTKRRRTIRFADEV